jgi:hypothetical protein
MSSLAKEVFGAPALSSNQDKAVVSIMSREAAISAARRHAAQATSAALRGYWEDVVKSLVSQEAQS